MSEVVCMEKGHPQAAAPTIDEGPRRVGGSPYGCPICVKVREERMSLDQKRRRQTAAHVRRSSARDGLSRARWYRAAGPGSLEGGQGMGGALGRLGPETRANGRRRGARRVGPPVILTC